MQNLPNSVNIFCKVFGSAKLTRENPGNGKIREIHENGKSRKMEKTRKMGEFQENGKIQKNGG